jgi:hypothetical protein
MGGMFMDGVLYASVSKNYALGFGTFWEPYFSATNYRDFHEQPPLLFFLQGLFCKMFGVAFYTAALAEKIQQKIAASGKNSLNVSAVATRTNPYSG